MPARARTPLQRCSQHGVLRRVSGARQLSRKQVSPVHCCSALHLRASLCVRRADAAEPGCTCSVSVVTTSSITPGLALSLCGTSRTLRDAQPAGGLHSDLVCNMVRSVERSRNVRAQARVHGRHDWRGGRSLGRLRNGVMVDHCRRSAPHCPCTLRIVSAPECRDQGAAVCSNLEDAAGAPTAALLPWTSAGQLSSWLPAPRPRSSRTQGHPRNHAALSTLAV